VDQLPYALDHDAQERLWLVSREATGAAFPWETSAERAADT
jgi:hypothetical protein